MVRSIGFILIVYLFSIAVAAMIVISRTDASSHSFADALHSLLRAIILR